jgi:hypothetical protein
MPGFTFECRSRKTSWQPHYQNNSPPMPLCFTYIRIPAPASPFFLHHRQNTGGGVCGEPQPASIVLECPARLLRFAFVFTPFAANVRDGCRLSESELRRRFRLFCVHVQPAAGGSHRHNRHLSNNLFLMGTLLATRYNTPPAALSADSAKEPSAEYGGPSGPEWRCRSRRLLP